MKGVSALISYMAYIAILAMVLAVIIPFSFDLLENFKDSRALENAKKIMIELDSVIRSLSINPGYEEIDVNFDRGSISYFRDNNEIAYVLKTKFKGVGAQSFRKIGVLKISGNHDVDMYLTKINNKSCYAMENSYLFLCILKSGNLSLNNIITSFRNKVLGKEFPANFTFYINNSENLSSTANLDRNLPKGKANINPRNIKITILGFSDFLIFDFGNYESKISLIIPKGYELEITGVENPGSGIYTSDFPYAIFYNEEELLGIFGYRSFKKFEYDNSSRELNLSLNSSGTALIIFSSGSKSNFIGKKNALLSGEFLSFVNPNFFERKKEEKEISVSIKYDPNITKILDFGKIMPGAKKIAVGSNSTNPAFIEIGEK